jgi:hypothetical protein
MTNQFRNPNEADLRLRTFASLRLTSSAWGAGLVRRAHRVSRDGRPIRCGGAHQSAPFPFFLRPPFRALTSTRWLPCSVQEPTYRTPARRNGHVIEWCGGAHQTAPFSLFHDPPFADWPMRETTPSEIRIRPLLQFHGTAWTDVEHRQNPLLPSLRSLCLRLFRPPRPSKDQRPSAVTPAARLLSSTYSYMHRAASFAPACAKAAQTARPPTWPGA